MIIRYYQLEETCIKDITKIMMFRFIMLKNVIQCLKLIKYLTSNLLIQVH